MPFRPITISDVCAVTGMTRFQLRNLLAALPGFDGKRRGTGSANTYSRQDLAVLAVCAELNQRFGLRREVIGGLSDSIRVAFSGPKSLADGAYLHVAPWTGEAAYCTTEPKVAEGLTVAIDPIVERIDRHLSFDEQPTLNLGPVAVGSTRRANRQSDAPMIEKPSSSKAGAAK